MILTRLKVELNKLVQGQPEPGFTGDTGLAVCGVPLRQNREHPRHISLAALLGNADAATCGLATLSPLIALLITPGRTQRSCRTSTAR